MRSPHRPVEGCQKFSRAVQRWPKAASWPPSTERWKSWALVRRRPKAANPPYPPFNYAKVYNDFWRNRAIPPGRGASYPLRDGPVVRAVLAAEQRVGVRAVGDLLLLRVELDRLAQPAADVRQVAEPGGDVPGFRRGRELLALQARVDEVLVVRREIDLALHLLQGLVPLAEELPALAVADDHHPL